MFQHQITRCTQFVQIQQLLSEVCGLRFVILLHEGFQDVRRRPARAHRASEDK